ncbi:hypothetical protein [Paenibacillus amylolyticus]|uniref:hypothetical protein n=1 Tax=Paenibacillus amylolyticus TaxID=1451 RepID=UPI003391B497
MSNWHYGIPKRENELRAAVKSPVITSQLSPEELEEIRQKYPATKADKAFKKPIEIKTRPKGDNDMAKFTLTEKQFNAERAVGKSIAKIAKEQGVSEATIYNHVSKWADARKPGQEKLLREKDVSPAADTKAELLDKAEKEIERLTVENQQLQDKLKSGEEERVDLVNEVTQFKIDIDWLEGEKQQEFLKWQSQVTSLMSEKEEWLADNVRLEEKVLELERLISQHNIVNTVPDSEVQRLDSAIQDLTRARWILNRLAASGE